MGIVCTYIVALVASHFLEPHPYVSLDIFNQMSKVNRTVGIGQGAGDQHFPLRVCHFETGCWLNAAVVKSGRQVIYLSFEPPIILRDEQLKYQVVPSKIDLEAGADSETVFLAQNTDAPHNFEPRYLMTQVTKK
jgi:hypothetical protein